MAEKNPFDIELPKESSNPFDVDIDIQKKNPIGKELESGFEPFQPQVQTKTPSVLTPKGAVEYQEQVKGYVPPKEVKQPKEEKPDFLESIKNSLTNIGVGVQQFIPKTQIALSSTLEGLLGKDLGSDFYRNIVGATRNPELDRQEAYAKLAELEPQFKRTRGLIESAENFDVAGLAAATIDAMSSLVRTAITSIPTAGIGLASDMVGGSIASYNQEKAKSKGITVDELYRRGENEFAVPAAIGAVGTGLEAIGLKGTIGLINKQLQGAAAKKFATVFVDVNKEGLTEFLQTGLDASNNALSQGKSIEDAGKIAVKEMFSKKGLESYLMGTVGSAGASGLGRVVKGMLPANKKKAAEATQKIAELETELNNPSLSPATQKFIAENIKQNVSQIADAVENDANEIEGLSDEQKFTINSVNEIINSYEEVLSDPNASEQTKVLAQEKVNQLDLEIDNILNSKKLSDETQSLISEQVPQIAKPTFDSEEQIIAEGQQAQAEFEATGDQVTYEQKMKELDDRAKNLVPAPEQEIGKPKEVVEIEPIRQLGTGANVYFETDKYRVNDELKNNKVLLNVQSETSETPIANIEFDNANDAVIIAKELNSFFPKGVPDAILVDKYIEQLKRDLLIPKPQEDATKIREIEQGRIGEYPRAIEQQQREQKDREDQEKLISEAEAEAGGRNRIVEGRQVEEDVIPKEEFATEEEYTLDRVDKENDPEELAALYYEQEAPEPDYKTEGIMDYLGSKTRINLRDWNRWNDVNNLTPQLRRRYIDSNNKSGGLDQSAMELSEMLGVEVTEEDFIDAILEFGSTKAYKEKGLSKVQKAISDKYYEITGKNLTEGRAERAYLKIKNKPKTDKEIYELNESLQEIGITYEDIERYNEYAKQELKGVEKPIRKTEPVARAGRKVREEGERVQEEVEKVSKSIGASPKNIKDLYDINRNLFGLNRVKSLASAVAMDRMISAMAKRAGVSKVEMYGKLKFEKQSDFDNLLKTPNVVFQGTFGGSDASFVTLPEGISIVDGWYSPIEKRLRETKIERQSANKWLTSGLIGKGDEAIYTGVKGWLEGKNPQEQVSKQDILDWMQNNRVDIVEVVKGAKETLSQEVMDDVYNGINEELSRTNQSNEIIDFVQEKLDNWYNDPSDSNYKELYSALREANLSLDDFIENAQYKMDDTQFSQYQLEGDKENYKELLVTLPSTRKKIEPLTALPEEYEFITDGKKIGVIRKEQTFAKTLSGWFDTEKEALDSALSLINFERQAKLDKETKDFKSSHFNEPNILVHLRMNTRTDAEGNKVLFLEEIQSDWGQKGKKEGFAVTDAQKRKKELLAKEVLSKEEIDELATLGTEYKVPTAPFVTDTNAWTKLGLKMALREAVNQGAEKIAWTTGEQQNDRYDLSKSVKRVDFIRVGEDRYKYEALDLYSRRIAYDDNGTTSLKNIENMFGKDIAEKVKADKNGDLRLEGEGLKVGGKGMKGFYDGIVPNVAKSLVKELTGKPIEVGETKINKGTDDLTKSEALELLNQGEKVYTYLRGTMYRIYNESDLNEATNYFSKQGQATSKQQSIDITPELKSSVERGIPLFQAGMTGAKGAMQAMADGSFIVYALTDPNVSTPLHELAHVYEHYLTNDEKQTVIKNAGTKGWTTETSEYFARGFENYLAEGKSPIAELNKVFAKFKEWLLDIYNGIKGSEIDIKLNDEMRNIYDLMFKADERKTEEVKRPVEAPRVDERSVTKAFDAIEEAKRSRKTQRGKIEAGELAVKEMGDIGKKAIFIDNNFKDIIAKIKEFKNDKGDSLIKINCQ